MIRPVLLATALAVVGTLGVAVGEERRLGGLRLERARLDDRSAALARELARRPALVAECARLRRLSAATGTTASFLRDAARAAIAHRTRIVSIVTSGSTPAANGRGVLQLTLEGRYAAVLATVAVVAGGPAAAVDVVSLTRKNGISRDATIDAAIRVELSDDGARRS